MAINPKIKQKAEDIRNKIFGSEVRESLASGIEAISEDVEATIGRQDYVEEQFQDVLDETTGKDVISAPELIAARNGKSSLKTRLDDEHAQVTAQLAQTEQEVRRVKANPNAQIGAVVTFIDDNGETAFYNSGNWVDIISATGVKIGIAVVSDWVGKTNYLTIEQLKQLQNEGHEIYSHSKTHPIWDNLSDAQIRDECSVSKYFLETNGFDGHDILVYSNGINDINTRVKNIVRQYYNYAITTDLGKEKYNPIPVDNWAVRRMDGDYSTLEQMKIALDEAIANNGWLIFYSHSFNFTETTSQKFIDFINYAKGLNVPIMPFKEAVKRKGNVMAIGEKTSLGKAFISAEGHSDISLDAGINFLSDSDPTALLSTYPAKTMSIKGIPSVSDVYFNKGGVLLTHNYTNVSGYAYQIFNVYQEHLTYKRIWNPLSNAWNEWVVENQYLKNYPNGENNITELLDKYPLGLTITRVAPAYDSVLNVGGVLFTHNYYTVEGYAFQVLVSRQEGEIYTRYWTGTAWSPFKTKQYKISDTKNDGSVLLNPITSFPKLSTTVTPCSINANSPYNSEGGVYTVTRFDGTVGEHYGYAEYKIYNSNALYRRYWTTGGAWSAWEKVSAV